MNVQKKDYKVITLKNFAEHEIIKKHLSPEAMHQIEVAGSILPFKVNNYVVEELIDWKNYQTDPIFHLTFPQKAMLTEKHFSHMESAVSMDLSRQERNKIVNKIRLQLNPHPAGQMEHNVPVMDGVRLSGVQHKYDQTVLFFPSQCQTCHAYCTFCFRWPQFTGMDELKFAMKETNLLIQYVKRNPQVTDILFTGGDPMVMSAAKLASHIEPILNANIPHLKTIRIGTKSLAYWPYRFVTDNDAEDILRLFEKIVSRGYHLSLMAHFNHHAELKTPAVRSAMRRILATGAKVRTQSPIMQHINDDWRVWKTMWEEQVKLGAIPYYMFIARDTGAHDYFAVTLDRAWNIYREAYQRVSGVARTVRGPSMSASPGKVQVVGVSEINYKKVFVLNFLQARNADWVSRPFFAKYDKNASWLDELTPAFGEPEFFYESEAREDAVSS